MNLAYSDGRDVHAALDVIIRVFMGRKSLDVMVDIKPQTFFAPERGGFTTAEWCGAKAK